MNISLDPFSLSLREHSNMWKLLNYLAIFGVASLGLCVGDFLPENERIDCHPEEGATEERCLEKKCIWFPHAVTGNNVPYCYVPKNYGYKLVEKHTENTEGLVFQLERSSDISMFGNDAKRLTVSVEFQSNYRLRIKITDSANANRFVVPLEIMPPLKKVAARMYDVQFKNEPVFSLKVLRANTDIVLFDTSLGGLTFSDQFIQFSTKLPSKNLYGIGENEQHSFRHSFSNYPNYALWGRDEPTKANHNLYGVQPYYTVLEDNGEAHSVAIVNSNAQEFTVLPTPGLLYRTIGGILDIYMFMGPSPEDVVQQYTEAVGRFNIPPYFSLGFHLCRHGYNNIDNMKAVVQRTAAAKIPHDAQWGDIDIMERGLNFTYNERHFNGLPTYVENLKAMGIKFITILDPCISINEEKGKYNPYDSVNDENIWIKDGNSPAVGKVWPETKDGHKADVYFPDYSNAATQTWWTNQIVKFKKVLKFDALWIDMNEPANSTDVDASGRCDIANKYNSPPYTPKIAGKYLADKTLCPSCMSGDKSHYDTHNLYGYLQSKPTLEAMTMANESQKRSFILSRSTFLGSGRYTAHWLGDNLSDWSNLRYSIIGILQFSQFGIPFTGADICGFNKDSNSELCQRWMQLGAFYPFSRNHNAINCKDQDPAAWGEEVARSSRDALNIRYALLPYLYTLFYLQYTNGSTVARPLFHEYPEDSNTYDIDTQFLWGGGFMISPVLTKGAEGLKMYFPKDKWYAYRDGGLSELSGWNWMHCGKEFIQLFVRGGHILPTQDPAINTMEARNNPMGLIVALNDKLEATGSLYYDSGESLDPIGKESFFLASYTYKENTLSCVVENDGYQEMSEKTISTIRLLGFSKVITVYVDGKQHKDFEVVEKSQVITNLKIVANSLFEINITTDSEK